MQDRAASFQKGSVESLKERLSELLRNENEVKEYKGQAQGYVCGKYNWDEVVEKTLNLYVGGI